MFVWDPFPIPVAIPSVEVDPTLTLSLIQYRLSSGEFLVQPRSSGVSPTSRVRVLVVCEAFPWHVELLPNPTLRTWEPFPIPKPGKLLSINWRKARGGGGV